MEELTVLVLGHTIVVPIHVWSPVLASNGLIPTLSYTHITKNKHTEDIPELPICVKVTGF